MSAKSEIQAVVKIPAGSAGQRLDQAAAQLFPDYSRSRLKVWIESGELLVDGAQRRPRDRVASGQTLTLNAVLPILEDWHRPQPVPFEVVFEDEHVLVVNKPAGVVVHPGAGWPDGTLVNGLLARYPDQSHLPRAGIVHRLDVGTSGLLLVARSLPAHGRLVAALARRQISRLYQAVAEGTLTGPRRIDLAVGRDPRNRLRMAPREQGRAAITHVDAVRPFARHCHVRVRLETGRTHQIRVHLSAIGHPLVGDRLYGARGLGLPPGATGDGPEPASFSRPALHAWQLAFTHPVDGGPIRCTCEPPADFAALLAALVRSEPQRPAEGR